MIMTTCERYQAGDRVEISYIGTDQGPMLGTVVEAGPGYNIRIEWDHNPPGWPMIYWAGDLSIRKIAPEEEP